MFQGPQHGPPPVIGDRSWDTMLGPSIPRAYPETPESGADTKPITVFLQGVGRGLIKPTAPGGGGGRGGLSKSHPTP